MFQWVGYFMLRKMSETQVTLKQQQISATFWPVSGKRAQKDKKTSFFPGHFIPLYGLNTGIYELLQIVAVVTGS